MKKKALKGRMLPVVMISFQDHSADLDGMAGPYHFTAVGVILKETEDGYVIGHWMKNIPEAKPSELGEVTTYIAKVKGMKIVTITHLVMNEVA